MCTGLEAIGAWLAEAGGTALIAEEAAALGVGSLFGEAAVGSVLTEAVGGTLLTEGLTAGAGEALGTGLKVGAVTESAAGLGSGISASAVPAASNAAVGGLGTGVAGAGAVAAGEALGAGLVNAGPFVASAANAGAAVTAESLMPLAGLANAAGPGLLEASLGKQALDTLKEYAPLLSAGATLLGSAAALNAAKSPNAAGTGTTLTADSKDATQAAVSPTGLPAGGPPASTTSVNPQDPRSPSALDLARRRKLAALGGEGSTLLTGGDGIDSNSLSVGKATLLGQ